MSVTKFPNKFEQQKSIRLKKQMNKFNKIISSPKSQWGDLFLENWPQVLPVYVITRLEEMGELEYIMDHVESTSIRNEAKDLFEEIEIIKDQITENDVLNFYERAYESNLEHIEIINPFLKFIKSLSKPTKIVVTSCDMPLIFALKEIGSINDDQEDIIAQTFTRTDTFYIDNSTKVEKHIIGSVFCALRHFGGIQIRSTLPLKVQRKNSDGKMEWFNQKKIYGFKLFKGNIIAITKQELTNAYCTGPNGEYWELDAGINIGDTALDFKKFNK